MTFDDFIDRLYEHGWNSPNDAQHENIRALWLEIEQAANNRIKFSATSERLKMIIAACEQARQEGWKHIPVKTVLVLATPNDGLGGW